MPSLLKPMRLITARSASRRKQAGAWIALLRARRDGADLDEAEAQPRPGDGGGGVLVEAGGETDGGGEVQAHDGTGQARVVAGWGEQAGAVGDVHGAQGQIVRALGVEATERRLGGGEDWHRDLHAAAGARWKGRLASVKSHAHV